MEVKITNDNFEAEVLKADRQVRDSIGIEHRGGGMLQTWYAKLNDTKKYALNKSRQYERAVDMEIERVTRLMTEPQLQFEN